MSSPPRSTEIPPWVVIALGLLDFAGSAAGIYSVVHLPWWGKILIILAIIVLASILAIIIIGLIKIARGESSFQLPGFDAVRSVMETLGFGSPGIAVALVIGVNLFHFTPSAGPCEPIDLRVVTGPENVAPVTAAAHRYIADRSGGGCPVADIDVTSSSSIEELKDGFIDGWTSPGYRLTGDCGNLPARVTLLGPRPDIWIPDSTLVADYVQRHLTQRHGCDLNQNPLAVKAELTVRGSIASSPVVLGIFDRANNSGLDTDPGEQDLRSLLQSFKDRQVLKFLSRPSPDAAQSGLLSTPLLHQALRAAGNWGVRSPADAEKLIDTSGISIGDTASILCGFRADDGEGKAPPDTTAVVLPESSLARYDSGAELADESACPIHGPSSAWRLYPHYARDLPVLDYPFVQVRWPGEDVARRDQAVGAFLSWLKKDHLSKEGFRTVSGTLPTAGDQPLANLLPDGETAPEPMGPHRLSGDPGCVGPLDHVLACYGLARPTIPVSLMLDISGSMANPVATTGPGLARAQELARRIVGDVRPATSIWLLPFSSVTQPANERAKPDRTSDHGVVLSEIQKIDRTNGQDLPLTTAIEQTLHQAFGQAFGERLVVLTDGQSTTTNRDGASRARELAAQVRRQNPGLRILIALTGPTHCGDQPVATIVNALGGRGRCVEGKAAVDDLALTVTYHIFWG